MSNNILLEDLKRKKEIEKIPKSVILPLKNSPSYEEKPLTAAEKNAIICGITDKEIDAIRAYQGIGHLQYNSLLEEGLFNEKMINEKFKYLGYDDKDTFLKDLETIQNLYSAMVKYGLTFASTGVSTLYRGTTDEEMSKLSTGSRINRFISTTSDKNMAEGYFINAWENKAVVYVKPQGFMPCVNMAEILKDYGNNWEKETLISPFTKVEDVKEISRWQDKNYYTLQITKDELPDISQEELDKLEKEITESCIQANKMLDEHFLVAREIEDLKIRKQSRYNLFEQYRNDPKEVTDIKLHIKAIEDEILQKEARLNNCKNTYSVWKDKVILYNMGSCRKVEQGIFKEKEQKEREKKEKAEQEKINRALRELNEIKNNVYGVMKNNFSNVEKTSNKLFALYNRQKKYKEVSEKLGIDYNVATNPNDANKKLSELKEYLSNSFNELSKIEISPDTIKDKEKLLDEFNALKSQNNLIDKYFGDLINQDLKWAEVNELNSFKKGINVKFIKLKASADLKKINEEKEKLLTKKGIFGGLLDKFTGQEKINSIKLEQLTLAQKALEDKIKYANNDRGQKYSVHDILSNIDMHLEQSKGNSLFNEETQQLQELRKNITQYFKVDQMNIQEITEQKLKNTISINEKNVGFLKRVFVNKQEEIEKIQRKTAEWIEKNGYSDINKNEVSTNDFVNDRINQVIRNLKKLEEAI